MTVAVRFLGSGNAFGDGGRSHACILVSAPGTTLLLDCGGSALPAIMGAKVADSIDAIAISHLHGDHFGGLPYYLIEQHYAGRSRPLLLAGPRELVTRLRGAEQSLYPDFYNKPGQPKYEVRMIVLDAKETALGGARVSALPVQHVAQADPHGIRVRIGDRLIAYSGDAHWSDGLAAVARGSDLFICDCTYWDFEEPSHASYRSLMSHRAEIDSKRIILTHLGADALAHASEMELEHAVDGLEVTV